jgi:O-antigen/teichoic acid export membrane protein
MILARLLVPEDFGLVGLAASVIAVAEILTQTGVGMAVIRRPSVDRTIYDTAWTLNFVRCVLLGGALAATAHWQAALLGDPRVAPIVMVVGLTIALDGMMSIGLARLQRDLLYDQIFRFEVVSKLTSFMIAMVFAVILQNYWCLVLGNLFARLIIIPYSYWIAPHSPRFCLVAWREMLHFSKWMLAANACGAIEGQSSNIAIGRLVGLPALGLWQLSWQVAAVPVTELAVPIRGPLYAGYAQAQQDRALLRRHFLGSFGLLCAVLTPLSVGIALVAPEIERIALGPAFAGAAPLIAFCALYAMIDAWAQFTHNLFIVIDAQRRMVVTYALFVLLRVPAVVAGALLGGPVGVGIALVATGLVGALTFHWQAGRLLGHNLVAVGREIWRSLAAAAVMAAAVLVLRKEFALGEASIGEALATLAVLAPAGALFHVGVQALLWRLAGAPDGAERRMLDIAGLVLGRLRRRRLATRGASH